MLERMGIAAARQRRHGRPRRPAGRGARQPHRWPDDVDFDLESLIARMIRLLLIEISAFHTFAWAEELLADPDLVAGDGEARPPRVLHPGRRDARTSTTCARSCPSCATAPIVGRRRAHATPAPTWSGGMWDRPLAQSLGADRQAALETDVARGAPRGRRPARRGRRAGPLRRAGLGPPPTTTAPGSRRRPPPDRRPDRRPAPGAGRRPRRAVSDATRSCVHVTCARGRRHERPHADRARLLGHLRRHRAAPAAGTWCGRPTHDARRRPRGRARSPTSSATSTSPTSTPSSSATSTPTTGSTCRCCATPCATCSTSPTCRCTARPARPGSPAS